MNTLSYVGFGLAGVLLISTIGFYLWGSSWKQDYLNCEIERAAAVASVENLTASLETQNEAIKQLEVDKKALNTQLKQVKAELADAYAKIVVPSMKEAEADGKVCVSYINQLLLQSYSGSLK